MSEVDRMAVIERWTIYPGRWIDFDDGPSYQMPTVEPLPEDGTASFEVVRADAYRGAVGALDEFRDGLTEALNAHGVPATASWREAIDWLAEHGGQ